MKRFLCLAAATGLLAAPAMAAFTQSLVIFGQKYRVDRFDYVQEVTYPNTLGGPDVPLVEVEGAHYLGNNRLLLGSGEQDSVGAPKNLVAEVEILYNGAFPTGLKYQATRVERGYNPLDPNDFDLDVCGVTINSGSTGLGAGGGVLTSDGQEGDGTNFQVRGYDSSGGLLEFPVGSGCLNANAGKQCGIDLGPTNQPEDLAYISATDRIYLVIDNSYVVLSYSPDGTNLPAESFSFGQAIGYPNAGEGKGLFYLAPGGKWPSALQDPQGIVVVTLDDQGPGLQAFDVTGKEVALAWLTDTGTGSGTSLLNLEGCANQLQLESGAADPDTGRLFLVNQSDGGDCGYLYVLAPTCLADLNLDFNVDQSDLGILLADYGCAAGVGKCPGDINGDGKTDQSDLGILLAEYGASCQP